MKVWTLGTKSHLIALIMIYLEFPLLVVDHYRHLCQTSRLVLSETCLSKGSSLKILFYWLMYGRITSGCPEIGLEIYGSRSHRAILWLDCCVLHLFGSQCHLVSGTFYWLWCCQKLRLTPESWCWHDIKMVIQQSSIMEGLCWALFRVEIQHEPSAEKDNHEKCNS